MLKLRKTEVELLAAAKGWTSKELCKRAGVHKALLVDSFHRGITALSAVRIAEALGVDVKGIIEEISKEEGQF